MTYPFKFSIVIPTYNHCDDLLKPCVESVIAFSRMTDVELVISANGCTDNTRTYVEQLQAQFTQLGFPDHVKLVWHDKALGFSRAVNAGIQASTGQRVLLLNNDVILLGQPRNNWLDRMNAPFETNPRAGITTTLKLYSPQTGRDFAVFFCTMIDRKLIDELGMLDEAFGVGAGEDTAYCFRAEEAGYEVIGVAKTHYEPSIGTNASDFPIWHKAEGTMHDPVLVPNWTDLFNANTQLLHSMFEPECLVGQVPELADKYSQLLDADDTETVNLFAEVIRNNGYGLTPTDLRNKEVIDVGANVGYFTLACAAIGAHKVFSYEPVSSTHERLTRNVNLLGLTNKVITHKQAVLGKSQDPVLIHLQPTHGANSLYVQGDQSEFVKVVSLHECMQQTFSHNVILKLDCEGAEYDILLDTPDAVFDRVKIIHVEIHARMHPVHKGRDILANRLTHLGFTCVSSKNVGIYWYNSVGELSHWEPGFSYVEFWRK
jgi:FkbM family methyltransferase